MEQINEAVEKTTEKISTGGKRVKKSDEKPWVVIGVVAAVLAAAYVGLCAYADSQDTFYPNSPINYIDVSGLTPEEAQAKLDKEVPAFEVPIYSEEEFFRTYTAEDPLVPLLTVTLAELGSRIYQLERVANYRFASPLEDLAADDTVLPVLGSLAIMEMEA